MSRRSNRWVHRFTKRSLVALAAGSATAGLINSAFAQTGGTWTYNGNDNWSALNSWFEQLVPNGSGNLAAFIGVGVVTPLDTITVTLDTNRTIGSLAFGDGDAVNSPAGWVLRQTGASVLTLENDPGTRASIGVAALGGGSTLTVATLFQKVAHISANLASTNGFIANGLGGSAGTLILSGNNTGLAGEINLTRGNLVAASATALGSASVTLYTGQMAFRGDAATNFATNIVLQNNSTFGTGNSIGTFGTYGSGSNQAHTLGNVTVDTYGVRTLGISGSNGYGLNIGLLGLRDGINLINQGDQGAILGAGDNNNVNGLGSGLVTVGSITYSGTGSGTINLGGVGSLAGDITVTNAITATGGGSAALVYSGSKTATIGGTIGTGGDTYVTGGTTGTGAAGNFQAGVGTLVVGAGALPGNKAVYINGGTLVLNGGALTHGVNGITMGGATMTTGPVPAHLNSMAGTVALGGSIVVNDSILFDATNTVATANATAGGISGRLDLGGSNRGVAVNGISTLTVGAVVNGAGGITKTGTGALILTNTNTFAGAIDVVDGVVAGSVKASGNALGITGANVSLGGAVRLNGIGSAGTGTVNTVTSKDTGIHSGFIVDATALGVTTLNINSYGGREANTHGTIKVVPVTGSLNTNEIVNISTGAPATTSGILPAYFAVQNSGTNTQLGFASLSSNRIVGFNSYQVGDINAASAVYDLASGSQTVGGGGKTLFAARIGANASVSGGTLELGNGTTGFGGLILNGNALLGTSTLKPTGTDELVIWSGGVGTNSISSNLNLTGDLTTGGSQAMDISGTVNFGASTRNITVTGAPVTLSNAAVLGTNGSFTKRGGGALVLTGDNALHSSGTITIQGGTLQLGAGGTTGGVGTSTIINNANLSINNSSLAGTFTSSISGTGNLWVNATSAGVVTAQGVLSYTGNTTVQSGTLKINGNNRLPTGTTLRVENGGTFDMNGSSQTLASIAGLGTIVNNGSGVGAQTTLTISGGGTFDGAIRNGAVGSVSLFKSTPGTLVLTSGNGNFNGTIGLSNGAALELRNGNAVGGGNIVLDNATLILNNNVNRAVGRNVTIQGGTTGTITVLANPNPNGGNNQFVTNGDSTITGAFNGGGTLVLDLRGRQLNIGNGEPITQFNAFTGTVVFPDSNPVGSKLTFANGTATFTTGNAAATFNFGNGNNTINIRNGTTTFAAGFVSGGTNTILMGCENGAGRTSFAQFGTLPGDQTFYGRVIDAGSPILGGFSPMGIVKGGQSSSLTLKGISNYTLPTTISGGTLILGAGGDIRTSPTINVVPTSTVAGVQTSTLQFGGGTLSDIGQFVNIGAVTNNATQSLSGALVVPNGMTSPAGVTFIGGGTIYGNLEHGAGSINPGTTGSGGTLTFANNLHLLAGGNIDFNVTNGSINFVGGGTAGNDLIRVLPNNGLSLDGGTIRVNFLNGDASLTLGSYYPLVQFSGAIGGGGTASLEAFAALALTHGSLKMIQGSGSLNNTIGARIDAIGGATVDLVWTPTSGNKWDIVSTKNWKQLTNPGSLLFFNTDAVTFNDSTTVRTVALAASGFQPARMTVNTNNVYTFTQDIPGAGSITGPTNFVKNGSGTVFFTMSNAFTGGATINDGWVVQNVGGGGSTPLGTQTITFNGNAGYRWIAQTANADAGPGGAATAIFNGNNSIFFPADNAGPQNLNWNLFGNGTINILKPGVTPASSNMTLNGSLTSFGGTIKVTDTATVGVLRFNSGGGNNATGGPSVTMDLGLGSIALTTRNAGAPFTFGALRGGPNTQVQINGNGVLTIGAKANSTFDGLITGGATSQVVKSGSLTTLTLTNLQTYTGLTNVNEGTLALVNDAANNLSTPTIIIGTAGVLDVNGLSSGDGILVLNANQRIVSNGNVVGSQLVAVSSSTIGGTQYNIPLFVSDGATISPGNSVGTLTVANMTLEGSANFLIEVDQTGIDTLVLSGTQTTAIVNGQSTLNLVNLGGFVPGTYTFLDYSGNPAIQGPIENGFVPLEFAYEVKVVHDSVNTKVNLVFVNNSAQWFVNNDGQWSTAPNWTLNGSTGSAVVPNSVTFGTFITAPRTVTVNSVIGNTANSIVFDSPQKYTIAGTGTLTLDAGAVAPITVVQGNHAINSPVRALKTLGVSVASGSTLSFGGTIINATNAGVNKIGGGTASFTRLNMPGGTLNVGAGSVIMTTKPVANSVNGTNLVANMTISAGAKVDLTNNAMILDYTGGIGTRLTDLRAELQDGRLFSSTAASNQTLGYRNNDVGTTFQGGTTIGGLGLGQQTTFAGVAADTGSVLIRVTYKGDSNLDGVVNVIDLYNMSLNWLSTNGVWAGGDFNYDGLVNQTDLGILSQNWQIGNNNPLPADDIGAALTAAGIPLSAVPEPGTLALAGVGAMGLLSRRRRRV